MHFQPCFSPSTRRCKSVVLPVATFPPMRPPREGRDLEALEARYVQHGLSLQSSRCPIHTTESNKCPLLEHFLKMLELYLYLQKIRRIVLCRMAQRGRTGDLRFTFSRHRGSHGGF